MKTGNSRQTVKSLLGVSIFGSFFRKGINSLLKSGGYPVKVRTFSHTFNETLWNILFTLNRNLT